MSMCNYLFNDYIPKFNEIDIHCDNTLKCYINIFVTEKQFVM